MLNVVVFTKDRPAQLDAMYRSFVRYFKDPADYQMTIVWKATTPDFREGYEVMFAGLGAVIDGYKPKVKLVEETNFRDNLLEAVDETRPLTMFLVDDIMFKAPFSLKDPEVGLLLNNKEILAVSLRLWEGITHCYATNTYSRVPHFVKGNVWQWKGCDGDWGYPFSVDGNIYLTKNIKPLAEVGKYSNPNEFEAFLASCVVGPNIPKYMTCYVKGSKLVNIPANRVQDQFQNRHANSMTCEALNKKFLDGWVISLTTTEGCDPDTVHLELPYNWTRIR